MSDTCCCGCGDTPPAHCLRVEIERLQAEADAGYKEISRLNTHINKLDTRIERLLAQVEKLRYDNELLGAINRLTVQ